MYMCHVEFKTATRGTQQARNGVDHIHTYIHVRTNCTVALFVVWQMQDQQRKMWALARHEPFRRWQPAASPVGAHPTWPQWGQPPIWRTQQRRLLAGTLSLDCSHGRSLSFIKFISFGQEDWEMRNYETIRQVIQSTGTAVQESHIELFIALLYSSSANPFLCSIANTAIPRFLTNVDSVCMCIPF